MTPAQTRKEKEALVQATKEKSILEKADRARRRAAGEDVPEPGGGALWTAVKQLLGGLLLALLVGRFITESWTMGYEGKWTNLRTYWPVSLQFP